MFCNSSFARVQTLASGTTATMKVILTCRSVQLCSMEDEMQDIFRHAVKGWLPGFRPCVSNPNFSLNFYSLSACKPGCATKRIVAE